MKFAITTASAADLPAIQALLSACGLPTEDTCEAAVAAHWVYRVDGEVVGTIALDQLGEVGVLRSLAVDPTARGQGLATELWDVAEMEACARGVRSLYLLTETAEWLATRRGYHAMGRGEVPAAIASHRQFASGCCSCAAVMSKSLGSDGAHAARAPEPGAVARTTR